MVVPHSEVKAAAQMLCVSRVMALTVWTSVMRGQALGPKATAAEGRDGRTR
jgi:hypothetical protein